jgi:beta-RFAP synthase
MPRAVTVTAASRLHAGLYALARGAGRHYGGVGFMVAPPGWRLELQPAAEFRCLGPDADRAARAAEAWRQFYQVPTLPAVQLSIAEAVPAHAGLGSGTQLALAVSAGLSAWQGRAIGPPDELARSVGRGKRSAVGTYGFVQGGLIAERGRLADEPFSPLDARLEIPAAWRFLLLFPRPVPAIYGSEEDSRLAALPPTPIATTDALIRQVREDLLPAVAAADFASFAASLHRFNREAGELFAPVQGGPYHGPVVTSLIAACQRLGGAGVGQSSWGPTVFVAQPNEIAAEEFLARLRATIDSTTLTATIAQPCNAGAQITVLA